MHFSLLRLGAVGVLASAALLPLAHCTSDTLTTTPSTTTIGPAGGALASSDYAIEILVPAGALADNVIFTITAAASSPDSSNPQELAPMYTITGVPVNPDSKATQSTTPVDIPFALPAVVSYTEQAYSGSSFHDPTDFRVAQYSAGKWTTLANPSIDVLAYTVQATTTTLIGGTTAGPFSVIIPPATGGACTTVTESCGNDGGCAAVCEPSIPGKCAAYAGAVNESCDAGTVSSAFACCYPSGTPTCFAQAEPNGCNSPCSQLPGATATSCIGEVGPPFNDSTSTLSQSTCCFPSGAAVCVTSHAAGACAGTTACATVTGSTMSSCTDSSSGAVATCCFPIGMVPSTLPSGSEGAAIGDAGGTTITDAGGSADAGTITDAGTSASDDAGG